MKTSLPCAAVVVLLSLFSSPLGAGPIESLILDSESRTLARVDLSSGKTLNSVALPDEPWEIVPSPDSSRLVVLFRGPGKTTFWTDTFLPTGKSSAVILDASSLETLGEAELGWSLGDKAFSADGKSLIVLASGVQTRKPAETRNSTLVKITLESGAESGRLELDRPGGLLGIAPDETTGVLFFPAAPKASPPRAAELRFVELDSMKFLGSLALAGEPKEPVAFPGGTNLYLLDPANGRNPGLLHVVSLSERSVTTTLEVGLSPRLGGMDPDSGRLFVLGNARRAGGQKRTPGELRIVASDAVIATIPVATSPVVLRLSEDRSLAYVAGHGEFSIVDLDDASATEPLRIGNRTSDLAVSPDDRHAIVHHRTTEYCCDVTMIDLNRRKAFDTFQTGSKAARVVQALGAAAASYASYQSGKSAAVRSGADSFTYTIYAPRVGGISRGPLIFRPDGAFAYALDTQTNDVTIVDSATGQRFENRRVAAGGQELVLLGDGRVLAIVADAAIDFVDTESNELLQRVELGGDVRNFIVAPDHTFAVALSRGVVVTIDADGTVVSRITSLKRPTQLLIP